MPKDENSAFERRIYPDIEEWSMIRLTCSEGDYSASRIARAVEDCDCHLVNLNVTGEHYGELHRPVVELRASSSNVMSVSRSLERYGYEILSAESSAGNISNETAMLRLEELMRYFQV